MDELRAACEALAHELLMLPRYYSEGEFRANPNDVQLVLDVLEWLLEEVR